MRLFFLFGTILLLALGISLASSDAWERIDALRAELHGLEAQNAEIRAENRRLAREAELLRTDPAALEHVARQEYGLVAPDDRVLLLGAPRVPRATP
jgi:cell division protein FtsB